MTKMVISELPMRSFNGRNQVVEPGVGGPALVTLWASWCPSCEAELTEFSERKADFEKAGIGLLALSVDGLGDERSDIAAGKKLLEKLNFPYISGLATQELVQTFQDVHDLLIPMKLPLPIPASFLFDGKGRLAVVYKGRASVDSIIEDAEYLDNGGVFTLEDVASFPGKSLEDENIERVVQANRVRTYFKRAVSLAEAGKFSEAVSYNLNALELYPDSYKIHFNIGTAYSNLKKPNEAIFHLNKSLELNPGLLLPHKVIGSVYLHQGQYEMAGKHYLSYLQGSPGDVEAMNTMAVIGSRVGKNEEAEKYLERAISIAPDFVEARYNLGVIQLQQKKNDEAENSFLKILSLQPDYPDVFYNLGLLAEQSGEGQRAINLYAGELRNTPGSVKAMTGLGRIYEQRGEYGKAREYYSLAAGINPSFQMAVEGLKRMSVQLSPAKK